MLTGADVKLEDITGGVVTPRDCRPLINLSACHVYTSTVNKDIVAEAENCTGRRAMPEVKEEVLFGKD